MHKIFTFGEILKDVYLKDLTLEEIKRIELDELDSLQKSGKIVSANDGGCSANVAAYTCLIGGNAVMLAGVGRDFWGNELIENFRDYGVNLKISRKKFTDCALIHVDENGRHEFVKFLWGSLPDTNQRDIDEKDILSADLVHIGSVTGYEFQRSKEAVRRAIKLAKKHGKLISFDPNLRLAISKNPERTYNHMHELFEASELRKLSAAELLFYARYNKGIGFNEGCVDYDDLVEIGKEVDRMSPSNGLLITLGEAGAVGFCDGNVTNLSSYDFGRTINTVGAGDAFMAAAIKMFIASPRISMEEILNYSCKIAGLSVTEDRTIVLSVKDADRFPHSKRYASESEFINAVNQQLEEEVAMCDLFSKTN